MSTNLVNHGGRNNLIGADNLYHMLNDYDY